MSELKKQPHVLFVDDEPEFLQAVTDLFSTLSEGNWQMHRAPSADAALEILKRQKMDLAVVDINMPMLDGVQFLRILKRRYPDLKKVTLTAFATEDKRTECLANGAELFIEKPRSIDGFKSIFVMLEDLVTWTPKAGFHGMLRQVSLDEVIQMECLGRNSSVLEINNHQVRGRIFIGEGAIMHATIGDETGEKAFQKILSIAGGEFKLLPFEAPGTRTIDGPWEFLLMEAARVRDEYASLAPAEVKPAVAEPEAPPLPTASIAETLICSAQGEPIYVWNCDDTLDRVAFLQNIAQQAALLSRALPLGTFERLEILQHDRRAVTVFGADRIVFVRSIHHPAE